MRIESPENAPCTALRARVSTSLSAPMHTVLLDAHDPNRWNAFVSASPYGHILQSWEWGELKARTGWRTTRLTVQDGDRIVAAAQVLLRALPYGFGTVAYIP